MLIQLLMNIVTIEFFECFLQSGLALVFFKIPVNTFSCFIIYSGANDVDVIIGGVVMKDDQVGLFSVTHFVINFQRYRKVAL
ncbi:MAG: hypothetical protein L0G16_00600 [Weeksellaceae bacterium]|nr:hypothetical protein [Weeksellaceae bacterium]